MRLIVIDLDGTLLTSSSQLPPEIHPIIDTLISHNIYVAIASGRQICNIKELFRNDKLIYITQNGSYVEIDNKEVFLNIISPSILERIVHTTTQNALNILLYSKTDVCLLCDNATFIDKLSRYKIKYTIIDSISQAKEITKVSIMSTKDNIEKYKLAYSDVDGIDVVVSHKDILDITSIGINKGLAVHFRPLRDHP